MNQPSYQPGERRPIATRERKTFRLLAEWLARCGCSPNAISLTGMFCAIGAAVVFAATSRELTHPRLAWFAGAMLVQLRLLANMLDGMVAITAQKASPVGELYNEVPDRVSDAAIFVGLGYSFGGDPVLGYAAAGVAIFTAYVRAMGKVAGGPQEFCGPMAKPHRMFLVTLLGCYNCLPESWRPYRMEPGQGAAALCLIIIIVGGIVTAGRRLCRTAAALRKLQP